ncbi:hypothetical protein EDD15DRAFT_2239750 [Pisolithus albus]|nr:hypothetical protein EDD15DRAFT_2239750 [Pisolithus albus]
MDPPEMVGLSATLPAGRHPFSLQHSCPSICRSVNNMRLLSGGGMFLLKPSQLHFRAQRFPATRRELTSTYIGHHSHTRLYLSIRSTKSIVLIGISVLLLIPQISSVTAQGIEIYLFSVTPVTRFCRQLLKIPTFYRYRFDYYSPIRYGYFRHTITSARTRSL